MSVRSTVRRLPLLVLLLAAPRAAGAVCTAQQIIAADPSCPASGSCTISGTYTVENGCTLDFGARVVNLAGRLNIESRSVTIRAGTFIVGTTGLIDALGDAVGARGGTVVIETTGPFTSAGSSRIDASGNSGGGDIIIRAGTTVTISGRMFADFLNAQAAGGLIDISANGNIVLTTNSAVTARGGSDSDGGGEIDLTAGGNLSVQTQLRVDGSYGGFLELRADGTVTMAAADATGGGDAGSGGCVDVIGGAGTTITGTIVADGAVGSFMTGGCGGFICLDGDTGTTTVAATARISASGAPPDGGGGQISLLSLGSTVINGMLEVRGPIGETCGGDVCIDTGLDATVGVTGSVDVSGGDAGGAIDFIAGRDVTINGDLDLSGRQRAALGGDVSLRAGNAGTGQLRVSSTIDCSSAASCSPEDGCGEGGSTDLFGCNVTVTSTGALVATGPNGGSHTITAREQLAVQGVIDATRTVPDGTTGSTRLEHPARKAPNLAGSNIAPAPVVQAFSTCPTQGPTMPTCLDPCPTCGNGQIEFPETCDNGAMPPMSCAGCSVFCRIENCNDGFTCTGDQCFPTLGCRHRVTPACTEPPTPTRTITGTRPTETNTPTPSSTRTNTATPTITATPIASPTSTGTASRTPTATGTATATPSPTASVTATPIASATSTGTASRTPTVTGTATATPSSTASITATPIASATTTDTPTPNPSATATASATAIDTATATSTATAPVPACIGDCSGDGSVTINELISGVNIALGNSAVATCPSFDRNADGSVTINELIAAVNAAQSGC